MGFSPQKGHSTINLLVFKLPQDSWLYLLQQTKIATPLDSYDINIIQLTILFISLKEGGRRTSAF